MPEKAEVRHTLSEQQARQLANVTKTVPDDGGDHAPLAGHLPVVGAR
jgi:hypothetical protein